ncbi:hypothetical protein [Aminobacter ciceronei]|uniref:Uncharacterized protein n=1 Tax=Aminobacter ciceronei TaxID=150723 RepID=A0ABR6CAM7_9HYPH|nr:hypothetical protein [Aminobacter ciceronei]MBA8908031.1 hypothetical protein [Aminobacter ciceronei]MBA9021786.1 hypothetical protein [Aminobacter ciceronei]
MLADDAEPNVQSGGLERDLHLPAAWRLALLEFIADELPKWRDDPKRPAETAETSLTSRFCAHMNSATRKSGGWDFLQFRVEEPDEKAGGRKLDLVPAPSAATIWIDGREYTQYSPLIPIECKRLPIPTDPSRDEREYLYSAQSSTGGVQRFKAGHHGAAHTIGAMIGYIQSSDVNFWNRQMRAWLDGLIAEPVDGWSLEDELRLLKHDGATRFAALESVHHRTDLPDIQLHHLWIDMAGLKRQ